MFTRVVNVKKDRYDIFIGRPSIWGNPFIIGKDGNRSEVIRKYKKWIINRPELMSSLSLLRGKSLGCYCVPEICHGHILADLADGEDCV